MIAQLLNAVLQKDEKMANPNVKKCRVTRGAVAASAESVKSMMPPGAVAWQRLGGCLYPLALAASVGASGAAHAELSDTIHPFIQTSITHDDNMLRQTEVPGQTGDLSDTSRAVTGGVLFERPISRQLISGHAMFTRVNYNRFSEFDYTGKDALVDWGWQLGNQLQGHLGSSYVQTLTPFVDTNVNERSLRTRRKNYGELNWLLTPSWQLHTGYTRYDAKYDLPVQRLNNRTDSSSEAGFDYLAPSGSKAGLLVRRVRVEYDQAPLFGPSNDYDQSEIKANVLWLVSGQTKISVLAGWAKRDYSAASKSDNSGANGRISGEYTPTGQLRLSAELWREFQALDGGLIGSSLNKGGSVAAAWAATAKISVNARVRRENRAFDTVNGIVAADGLSDNTTSASLGLNYTPLNRVTLGLDVFRDKRAGNPVAGSRSYEAKGVSVNANVQF